MVVMPGIINTKYYPTIMLVLWLLQDSVLIQCES